MSHCHQLTVASKALQSIAWSQGIGEERVVYLPNGTGLMVNSKLSGEEIAAQRVALGIGDRPVLLLYSRLFEFETIRLARILAGVKAAVPDIAILSIGEGLFADDAIKLQDDLVTVGVLPSVIDLGWRDLQELPLLLSCADVAIYLMDDTLLNRTKCPVKLADLIGLGVPVVAESVGQVPEYIISGRNGRLCRPGDVDGFIESTISLLKNKSECNRMAEGAKVHYQANFAWDLLVDRLIQAYERT